MHRIRDIYFLLPSPISCFSTSIDWGWGTLRWDRWSLTRATNCSVPEFWQSFSFTIVPPRQLPLPPSLNILLSPTLSLSYTHTHSQTHVQTPLCHPDDIQLCQALSSLWLVCECACVCVCVCVLYGHQVIIHQQMEHYLLLLTPSVSFPTFPPKNTFFM